MMNAVRPCSRRRERVLDLLFGADVHRAGRFVEDQDPRVGEQRPRERDELALAEREPGAALAELRLVAVLEPIDELVCADGADRRDDLLAARLAPAERDVLGERAGEQEAFLRDDAELAAQRLLRRVAQVDAVERDASLGGVVEAREQLGDRRLARTGMADERHGRACGDVQVDPVQHLRPAAVGEAHRLELDVARAHCRA